MKYLSKVEDYFYGKLKGKDLEDFNLELKTNSKLRDEFLIYKRAINFTLSQESYLREELRKLKDFNLDSKILLDIDKYSKSDTSDEQEDNLLRILKSESKIYNKNKRTRFLMSKWVRNVAVFALIIGLSITGILIYSKYYTSEELFDKFYVPYNHHFNTRSFHVNENKVLAEGIRYYDKAIYDSALLKLELLDDSLAISGELLVVKGVCYIELGDFPNAIMQFNKINSNCLLYDASLWYQGLCYLKIGDKNNAKIVFKKLEELEPNYPNDTKKLLWYLK